MRKPLRDLTGRQYGETVRGATARPCSGEALRMIEYCGESNEHVMRAFARDIEKGHYDGRLVYSAYTALNTDKETTLLWVHFSETLAEPYTWGQEKS